MAKGRGAQRRVPSTPATPDPADSAQEQAAESGEPAPGTPAEAEVAPQRTRSGYVPLPDEVPPSPREQAVIHGTRCVAGHVRGAELDAGPLGRVPSAKTTWIGLAILGWCAAGLLFMSPGWLLPAFGFALLWWLFSLGVQRRAGHRGRCLRTRAWRHAWGGLVPRGKDPTRPAEGEDD